MLAVCQRRRRLAATAVMAAEKNPWRLKTLDEMAGDDTSEAPTAINTLATRAPMAGSPIT